MTVHEEVRHKLALAAAGELPGEALGEVRRHAADCPACATELTALEILVSGLRGGTLPEAPDALVERTRALMLERLAGREERERHSALCWMTALAWAAGIGTLLLARILWLGPSAALEASGGSALAWLAAWSVLTWCTAGVAAAGLAYWKQNGFRREPKWAVSEMRSK